MNRSLVSRVWPVAVTLALFAPLNARAEDYPSRTIRMIVPFGAGGPTDVFTRVIGEELRKALGQPVVLENRPGAGTIIGTTEAAKSAPDIWARLAKVWPSGLTATPLRWTSKWRCGPVERPVEPT